MIFVMLGTNPYPFDRLLNAVSQYAAQSGEKVVAQVGNTPPVDSIECHKCLSHSVVLDYIAHADVVVCQGGYGSINDCLTVGARTVVVPRRQEFGECVDNQVELVEEFAKEGLIIPVMDIEKLSEAIGEAREMQVKKKNPSFLPIHIATTIRNMLEGVEK